MAIFLVSEFSVVFLGLTVVVILGVLYTCPVDVIGPGHLIIHVSMEIVTSNSTNKFYLEFIMVAQPL